VSELNLEELERKYHLRLETEEHPEDRRVRHVKELALFFFAGALLAVVFVVCLWIALAPSTQPENRKWAMSILAAMVSGFLGYLLPRR